MNDMSVRGIYRRYVVEPRIELFGTTDPTIVGDTKNFSVANDLMGSTTGSLKACLKPLALTMVGPADWYQNVCDNIVGHVAYDQTWTHIDVRIRLDADSDISGATLSVLQNTWKTGIEAIWNNPVPSPGAAAKQWECARAGEVPCRVSFRVQWVLGGAHHAVAVHSGSGATDESDWYATDPGSTAAHEFGHMLGHPDEYAASNCEDRAPVGTGTVMDTNTTFIPQRLVQFVANEIGSTLQ